MNKKILMLAPFMGLLLTSCNNWKTISKEKMFKIRDNVVTNIYEYEVPKKFKEVCDGGEYYTMAGATIKIDLMSAYDYDKMFYMSHTISDDNTKFYPDYYVEKDGALYHLFYLNGVKQKYKYEYVTAREAFDTDVMTSAQFRLMFTIADIGDDPHSSLLDAYIEEVETAKEMAKEDPKHFAGKISYSSCNDKSFKVVGHAEGVMQAQGTSMSSTTDFTITVENGLIKRNKHIMNMSYGEQEIKMGSNNKYSYGGSVTIPEEADPDTWCD